MAFEEPEHRDVAVNIERQLRLARAYAEGRHTPYKGASVIEITRRAIQKARDAGQNTEKYENELEALALAAQFRPLRDRISILTDKLRNPPIRSQKDEVVKEAKDIRDQIEAFEQNGIDVAEIKKLFLQSIGQA